MNTYSERSGLSFLFPSYPEHLETGPRRGTLIIAPVATANQLTSAGVPIFRHQP